MAEVAGTTVGVISLGLQVCQGLFNYYNQFKSFSDDVSSTLQRLEELSGLLEVLDQHMRRSPADGVALDIGQDSVAACGAQLRKLQEMIKKCGECQMPAARADRVKLVKRRLLYPFRKETLNEMHATLDRLQSNVNLAAQLLQM